MGMGHGGLHTLNTDESNCVKVVCCNALRHGDLGMRFLEIVKALYTVHVEHGRCIIKKKLSTA